MSAPAGAPGPERLHAAFLSILPRIERHGRVYFRRKHAAQREELIAEMVGVCWLWFVRLVRRGKDPTRFPSALAGYAARAVHSGRRICGQERARDVLSPVAQARHGFVVVRLPDFSTRSGNPLAEALIDNTATPVIDQVAFRIDFPLWLGTLGDRNRRVALDLMRGERAVDVAARYRISPGRVSQLRRAFRRGWRRLCGEDVPGA